MTAREALAYRRGWLAALRKVWREFGGAGRVLGEYYSHRGPDAFEAWSSWVQPPRQKAKRKARQ